MHLAVASGALGRLRVSTADQNLRRQVDALQGARCIRVFEEKLSGQNAERPEWWACLDCLREGDTLVVLELSRLGRSLADLLSLVSGCVSAASGSPHCTRTSTPPPPVDAWCSTSSPPGRVHPRTREGLAAANANGARLGRPPAMTPEQVRHARALLAEPDNTVASIARLLGVSRSTIYECVPGLSTNRAIDPGSGPQPALPS
ncbi:recombinase family protein [Saccharopolyspora sp. NPDC000995]